MSKKIESLKKQIVNTREYNGLKETTVRFTRKTGKFDINKDEVVTLLDTINAEAKKTGKTIRTNVRIMNKQRTFTVKSFSSGLEMDDMDEYYKGTVKDVDKFEMLSDIYITIQVYDKKKK